MAKDAAGCVRLRHRRGRRRGMRAGQPPDRGRHRHRLRAGGRAAGPQPLHPHPGRLHQDAVRPVLHLAVQDGADRAHRRPPISTTQGRTLGGGSSVNGMIYNRGQPADFDSWAQRGNRGWGYADVLPYFRRTEQRIGVGDDAVRGRDGGIPVTDMDWINPVSEAFIQGCVAAGIPRNPDYNSGDQAGVGYFQRAIQQGTPGQRRPRLPEAGAEPRQPGRPHRGARLRHPAGRQAGRRRPLSARAQRRAARGAGPPGGDPVFRHGQHGAAVADLRHRAGRPAGRTRRARAARACAAWARISATITPCAW